MTPKLAASLGLSVEIVFAHDINYVIGRNGKLPWHLPEDLKRFKELTGFHSVVMGRGTYESLPMAGLPNRRNYVVSRSSLGKKEASIIRTSSLLDAIRHAVYCKETKLFIIGGARLYEDALRSGFVDVIHKTLVDKEVTETGELTYFTSFKERLSAADWSVDSFQQFEGFSTTVLRSIK